MPFTSEKIQEMRPNPGVVDMVASAFYVSQFRKAVRAGLELISRALISTEPPFEPSQLAPQGIPVTTQM
jgi:hypothetical protein